MINQNASKKNFLKYTLLAALAITASFCAYLSSNPSFRHAVSETATFIPEWIHLPNSKAQELFLGMLDCYGTAFAKDYDSADGALARADPHILNSVGPHSLSYCLLIHHRASLAQQYGHTDTAEKFFNYVVEHYPNVGSQIGKVYASDRLAHLLFSKDRKRAIKLRQDNVSITGYLAATDCYYASDYIRALEKLGFTYHLSYDYSSAIQTFHRQLQATKQTHGETSWRYGECLLELGRAELADGQYDISAIHLRQALNLFKTTHSTNWSHDHEQESIYITDELLAQNSLRLNDTVLAKNYLVDAIQIRSAVNKSDAIDFVRLSKVQRLNGNYAASERVFADAAYFEKSPEMLQEKATIAALQDRPVDALKIFEEWSVATKGREQLVLISEIDFAALATDPLSSAIQTSQKSRRRSATNSINNLDTGYLLTATDFRNLITATSSTNNASKRTSSPTDSGTILFSQPAVHKLFDEINTKSKK